MHTIKGVNFLGPNCDYVTSGSDCGYVFIWRKKDGELTRVMKGDKRIVNCVEQHPSEIVVASSGIENDIKVWAPGESENPSLARIDEVCSLFFSNLLCILWIMFFGCTTCQIWPNVSGRLSCVFIHNNTSINNQFA